jgi:hypothetical protein
VRCVISPKNPGGQRIGVLLVKRAPGPAGTQYRDHFGGECAVYMMVEGCFPSRKRGFDRAADGPPARETEPFRAFSGIFRYVRRAENLDATRIPPYTSAAP